MISNKLYVARITVIANVISNVSRAGLFEDQL
jgi:hypothetical protein